MYIYIYFFTSFLAAKQVPNCRFLYSDVDKYNVVTQACTIALMDEVKLVITDVSNTHINVATASFYIPTYKIHSRVHA